MWARLNDNDTIAQLYMRPVGITLDGVQYPASIFSLWSASELKAIKIWSITMTNSPSEQQWYNVSTPVYAVTKDGDTVTGVTGTYTNTEKIRITENAGKQVIRKANITQSTRAMCTQGHKKYRDKVLKYSNEVSEPLMPFTDLLELVTTTNPRVIPQIRSYQEQIRTNLTTKLALHQDNDIKIS